VGRGEYPGRTAYKEHDMKMNPHQRRVNDDIAAAVSLETPADSAS